MNYPFPVYGNLTLEYQMIEIELGKRVAEWLEDESWGWSALMQLSYEQYMEEHR